VIDEIQHLILAKGGGSEKMLNFFVTLVNTIGIPVIMIGTKKAMPILQSEFRQARRGSGQGDLIWDRMKNDISWQVFVTSIWKHQWTKNKVLLTDEIKNTLYEESQGIIDIAVKLYAMVQIKAISTNRDTFEAKDFRVAASEKLGLVKPMLDALRKGDERKILKYGDISPISIDDYFSSHASLIKTAIPERSPEKKVSVSEKTILRLLELGVEPEKAKRLTGKALAVNKSGLNAADVLKEAYYLYVTESKANEDNPIDEKDLREDVDYKQLKKADLIDEMEW
jgi:hypothetical protein